MLVAREDGAVVGTAALELYADGALLRSVAVDPRRQGQAARPRADRSGAALSPQAMAPEAVFLLTTTAERFFPKFGFEPIDA